MKNIWNTKVLKKNNRIFIPYSSIQHQNLEAVFSFIIFYIFQFLSIF